VVEKFIERGEFSINDIWNVKNKLMIFTLLFIGLMIIFSYGIGNVSAASGDNIYVNTHGNDSWNGQNPVWNGTSGPKLSIKNATEAVNKGGTVKIANGLYNGTRNTHINIDKNVNIIGQSKDGTVIDGNGKNWIFNIKTGVTVNVGNLTLINGRSSNSGGAIYNKGTLTVNNCTFKNNNAYGGGAIDNYIGGILNVMGSTFNHNQAVFGGAIENAGKMNVNRDVFTDNSATFGGAIDNADTMSITNSSLTSNHATTAGGAVSNYEGYIELHFNKIVGNAAGTGSAVVHGDGSADLTQNWWGSNSGPLSSVVGTSNIFPWLILNSTTKKTSTNKNNTVTVKKSEAKQEKIASSAYTNSSTYKSTNINLISRIGVQFKTIRITFSQPIHAGTLWIEIKNSMGNIKIIDESIQGNVLIIKVSALLKGKYIIILHNASITNLKGNPIPYSVCNFDINSPPILESYRISKQNDIVQTPSSISFNIKNILLQPQRVINEQLIRI
jgi:hypothetical protein